MLVPRQSMQPATLRHSLMVRWFQYSGFFVHIQPRSRFSLKWKARQTVGSGRETRGGAFGAKSGQSQRLFMYERLLEFAYRHRGSRQCKILMDVCLGSSGYLMRRNIGRGGTSRSRGPHRCRTPSRLSAGSLTAGYHCISHRLPITYIQHNSK